MNKLTYIIALLILPTIGFSYNETKFPSWFQQEMVNRGLSCPKAGALSYVPSLKLNELSIDLESPSLNDVVSIVSYLKKSIDVRLDSESHAIKITNCTIENVNKIVRFRTISQSGSTENNDQIDHYISELSLKPAFVAAAKKRDHLISELMKLTNWNNGRGPWIDGDTFSSLAAAEQSAIQFCGEKTNQKCVLTDASCYVSFAGDVNYYVCTAVPSKN